MADRPAGRPGVRLRDEAGLARAVADLIAAEGGQPDLPEVQAVVALGWAQAPGEGPQDLLPYEVMLIRLAKYVAARLPTEVHRDRARRRGIRERLSELLEAQGLDPTGARVVPRR